MARFILILLMLCAVPISQATITNQSVRTITSSGNGSTTNFTIGFPFQDNDEIVVFKNNTTTGVSTEIQQGSGSSKFSITGGDPGTTVVMGTAPSTSEYLIIIRSTSLTQSVDYDPGSVFPAVSHEEQMDRFTQTQQELSFYKPGFPTSTIPATGQILKYNGSTWQLYDIDTALSNISAGGSPLQGPGSATDNTLPRFDGSTGLLLQGSGIAVDDSNNVTIPSLTSDRVVIVNTSGIISTSTYQQITSSGGANATQLRNIPVTSTVPTLHGAALYYNAILGDIQYAPTSSLGAIVSNSTINSGERLERINWASCGSSPCAIASQSGAWVNSVTRSATGTYAINVKTNMFIDPPTCECTVVANSLGNCAFDPTPTKTSVGVYVYRTDTGAAVDSAVQIICMGPR